ncbi:sensor histidine kinase [Sporosalibacterium faouarense]|uniref:sensor histidine kinase n=1 Tax=Sporosalibacterium faouarense TaxID=516123 RepID=UPI00141D14E6|nr:sensor histidine kinase [Sporosalibacterium faouarense]MTI48580.1 sensor histidine kinase [Bacillota bacterium]
MEKNLDKNRINEILKGVLDTIESSKEEIFAITEKVRENYHRTKQELDELQEKASKIIREVDLLRAEERRRRKKLVIVSKDFQTYSEKDIKEAYEKANDLRVKLVLKREEEKAIIEKRKNLELRLKDSIEVLERAERLTTQVSVAMGYLSGNLNNIIDTIDNMNKKQFLGIKIIEAQEEERQRVARDIHDGPAQSLANLALNAELCEKLLSIDVNRAKEELRKLKQIVRSNLKDVRKIIYDLRPMSLDDLGLVPTVQRYVSVFSEETGINSDLQLSNDKEEINQYVEIAAFRIIQESLNNIRKHSKAKYIKVKIETNQENLNLYIEDDGIGFDMDKVSEANSSPSGGFGLIGIKERAELLGGTIDIESSVNNGTKINVKIPLNGKDDLNEE